MNRWWSTPPGSNALHPHFNLWPGATITVRFRGIDGVWR